MAGESAARGQPFVSGQRVPLFYERLVIGDGAVKTLQGIAQAIAKGFGPPHYTLIRARASAEDAAAGAGVAWRADGVDPTPTDGMPMEAGGEEHCPYDPAKLRFVRLTNHTVTLHIHYFW